MGMFDSFLGQDTGYTAAQSSGLRRSAEIKKRRKEDERAFEREKIGAESKRALAERNLMEAGETRRTEMRVAGSMEQARTSNVGQMARQRLVGEQQRGAATTKAFRAADTASMKYGRELTKGEIKHGRDLGLAEIKGKGAIAGLFDETPGNTARDGLPGNQTESAGGYTFAQFTDLPLEKQKPYMSYIKKHDTEKYLDFARQYKLLYAPKEEETNTGTVGRSVYQSNGGTYRNY